MPGADAVSNGWPLGIGASFASGKASDSRRGAVGEGALAPRRVDQHDSARVHESFQARGVRVGGDERRVPVRWASGAA